jgi:hypothetical protein
VASSPRYTHPCLFLTGDVVVLQRGVHAFDSRQGNMPPRPLRPSGSRTSWVPTAFGLCYLVQSGPEVLPHESHTSYPTASSPVPRLSCPMGPTRLILPRLVRFRGSPAPWVPSSISYRIQSGPEALLPHGSHPPYLTVSSPIPRLSCPMGPILNIISHPVRSRGSPAPWVHPVCEVSFPRHEA